MSTYGRVVSNTYVLSVMSVTVAILFQFMCIFQFGPCTVHRKFSELLISVSFFRFCYRFSFLKFCTEKVHKQMQYVFERYLCLGKIIKCCL